MSDREIIGSLLQAKSQPGAEELFEMGIKVGKLYTDQGFPVDMSLDTIKCTKEQKMQVLFGALNWLIQHRRNSGATDKAIDRQRASNVEAMARFIETGETGIY